jgi:hypothetical protein
MLVDRRVHLETNGTTVPTRQVLTSCEVICVSPKLNNAGQHRGHQNPLIRAEYADLCAEPNLHLKVVCRGAVDVAEAVQLADSLRWPRARVWVMPEGTTTAVLNQRWPVIADAATKCGINATHRLHVLAWGDERGH